MAIDFKQLIETKERLHEHSRLESRRQLLAQRMREQEALIIELKVKLDMEQRDVEKLTTMSLTNLFHTILRSKEEQLELERQEALAAALKLQEAEQTLAELKEEQKENGLKLAELANAESEYNRLMHEKEEWLRTCPQSALELDEMELLIAEKSLLLKELREALSAGKSVMSHLSDASNSLEKAENWGNWDMWANGGLISTHIKHEHIDDARSYIHNANRQLEVFHKELADLKQAIDVQVDIGGILKMADYWFDGLIADWIVQGRINDAQQQTLNALHQVRMVVNTLEASIRAEENELTMMYEKRKLWIEQASL
ncbi:hypothetical protein [Paenibacillus camelliae]|uniref:hypothetical protein n=1 Tax=Paenibacillus camelliae TaxID=512410 RepID=UPI00203BC4F7|nr:hypothetical protein [Paenibacillus camelliae]MCM3635052.1 hypothetical protein [Paenibacillus camelliae]